MKAKTKFNKMYWKLPKDARVNLIMYYWKSNLDKQPYSLNIVFQEIKHDTKMGKKMLKDLGFKDDKEEMLNDGKE
jgi:hypothetical protein